MQGQEVTFSCQTFLARLRLLIYGRSGELSLISTRISSMVSAWRAACRSILCQSLSFPTIEPKNPVIPLPSIKSSLPFHGETDHMIGNGHRPENQIHSFFSPHLDPTTRERKELTSKESVKLLSLQLNSCC